MGIYCDHPRPPDKGAAMSKFDWVELETLNGLIAHSQKRLAAARASDDHRLVTLLQQEIAEAEDRRTGVLANLTKQIDGASPAAGQPTHIPLEKLKANKAGGKPQQIAKTDAAASASLPRSKPPPAGDIRGDTVVWDKLTQSDLERVKRALAARRSEMLARHAEELKALEADQSEIDAIERAIAAFTQKLKSTGGGERVPSPAEAG